MSTSQNLAAQVARWALVLPAAVGAYFGVQLLVVLINAMSIEGWADWVVQLVNSGAGPYYFVYAGGRTAPRHQFIAGIVLAVIFGIVVVSLTTAGAILPAVSVPFWWLALTSAVGIGASIFAILQLREDEGAAPRTEPPVTSETLSAPSARIVTPSRRIVIDDNEALPLCVFYNDGVEDDAGAEEQIEIGLSASEEGDLPAALDAFRRASELDPYHPWARYNYGIMLSFADKHAAALGQYRSLKSLHPDLAKRLYEYMAEKI